MRRRAGVSEGESGGGERRGGTGGKGRDRRIKGSAWREEGDWCGRETKIEIRNPEHNSTSGYISLARLISEFYLFPDFICSPIFALEAEQI